MQALFLIFPLIDLIPRLNEQFCRELNMGDKYLLTQLFTSIKCVDNLFFLDNHLTSIKANFYPLKSTLWWRRTLNPESRSRTLDLNSELGSALSHVCNKRGVCVWGVHAIRRWRSSSVSYSCTAYSRRMSYIWWISYHDHLTQELHDTISLPRVRLQYICI